jgi:hypothetical protein
MAGNVDSHDESSKPISVPRGSAHGKWAAHRPSPLALKGAGNRYDHSDDHIHLCSALGRLGSLYCLGLSLHGSNVFDIVVEETY